jgi:hypothetical protein
LKLGFTVETGTEQGATIYLLDIAPYKPRTTHIRIMELANEQ